MGEPIREAWIRQAVQGKTFAEVGGLGGTIHEQVSVAADAGATSTMMIDGLPEGASGGYLWERFRERLASLGVTGTKETVANLDDLDLSGRVGAFDVVSCSGVLYHCPEPLHSLQQLRRITRKTLILGTATVPEIVQRPLGTVLTPPGAALLVPAMTDQQRAVLGDWLRANGANDALGVNAPMISNWHTDDYAAWWWFFSVDYVSALLKVAGFTVRNVAGYWDGRATLYHAEVTETSGPALA